MAGNWIYWLSREVREFWLSESVEKEWSEAEFFFHQTKTIKHPIWATKSIYI